MIGAEGRLPGIRHRDSSTRYVGGFQPAGKRGFSTPAISQKASTMPEKSAAP
jgi:hypothetical protein